MNPPPSIDWFLYALNPLWWEERLSDRLLATLCWFWSVAVAYPIVRPGPPPPNPTCRFCVLKLPPSWWVAAVWPCTPGFIEFWFWSWFVWMLSLFWRRNSYLTLHLLLLFFALEFKLEFRLFPAEITPPKRVPLTGLEPLKCSCPGPPWIMLRCYESQLPWDLSMLKGVLLWKLTGLRSIDGFLWS